MRGIAMRVSASSSSSSKIGGAGRCDWTALGAGARADGSAATGATEGGREALGAAGMLERLPDEDEVAGGRSLGGGWELGGGGGTLE